MPPSLHGIGVDILHLPRLRALIARRGADALARRILGAREKAVFSRLTSGEGRERFLGVRWAAKEAAYKALFPAVRVTWKDVEVLKGGGSPRPELVLVREEDREKVGKTHVSVSHDGEYVVAYVVAEGR